MKCYIPNKILYSLDELEKLGIFNKFTGKKMINAKYFNPLRIGNTFFIKSEELSKILEK